MTTSNNDGLYHQQHQAQQFEQNTDSLSFDEEYLAAQRAAYESIMIGRETNTVVQQQGEQLQRAETIADHTQYQLDRATRLLKGMTWSGWVNNMFTALPTPTTSSSTSSNANTVTSTTLPNTTTTTTTRLPSLENNKYEHLPSSCSNIIQAIQNYYANVAILEYCETNEQKFTCQHICNEMYKDTSNKLQQSHSSSDNIEAYIIELKHDLEQIRKHQLLLQSQAILTPLSPTYSSSSSSTQRQPQIDETKERNELFGTPARINSANNTCSSSDQNSTSSPQNTVSSTTSSSPKKSVLEQKQDEHLNILSTSLNELGTIAQSLNAGLQEQNSTIESLENKSDVLHETSKMVTRRTNRIIQNKSSWLIPSSASQSLKKSIFFGTVMIRHVASGKYLSVMGTDLYLVNQYHTITCTYDLYQRNGGSGSSTSSSNIIGIKSHANHKWIGQSFLTGTITCTASSFGKREEFETDNSSTWTSDVPESSPIATTTSSTNVPNQNYTTRLLCVSAGWGQGGYLHINSNDKNYAIQITGITLDDSKNAAMWSITRIG